MYLDADRNFPQPCLNFLKSKVNIETVIDIGVRQCTPYLMKAFPDKKHILFEIIIEWAETIKDRYKDFNYDLHTVGLSDTNEEKLQLVHENHMPSSYNSLSTFFSRKLKYSTLDSIMTDEQVPYLIKIDVDGDELKILTGAVSTISKATIIIVEGRLHCTKANMLKIMNAMFDLNFRLWDMFLPMYYGDDSKGQRLNDEGRLEQIELVFISEAEYSRIL
jgi:FkbM family methyltransferase